MPEGHTVHRAARLQHAFLAGRAVRADSPQGRFADGAALLDERSLERVEAYGKHLLYAFADGLWLHVHLGLYGKFRYGTGTPPAPRGAVRLRLWTAHGWLTLSGPTACEIFTGADRKRLIARLGPDPLRPTDRPARAIARILRSGAPFGALLMDQSVIAGIGNVYRAELAFRAGISPDVPGRELDRAAVLAVWRDARALLRDGERSGRIITTRPADRPHPRGAVRRGEQYYVYHRTGRPCFVCATPIVSRPLAGRTVYCCPHCQPAPKPNSARIAGIRLRKPKNPPVAAGQAALS
jgi:formamidopyrimidine-DNA glycosylase